MFEYSCGSEIIQEFLIYIETIRNYSKRTVYGYFIDLRGFFRFILRKRGLIAINTPFNEISIDNVDLDFVSSITRTDVFDFLQFVSRECSNNANSRARKMSSLRAFYSYLTVKTGKLKDNPVADFDVPKQKKTVPKFLTLEESISLLSTVSDASEDKNAFIARDYCILSLFLNCGMRLSELVSINDGDIRNDEVRLLGKGNKERMIHLNKACIDAIRLYQDERDSKKYTNRDPHALFLSKNGRRISARRVEQIVSGYLKAAGLDGRGYSVHKLRHTAATLMYQYGGADMLVLKEILGHEHVSTTEIYTHVSNDRLAHTMDSSPLSRIKTPGRKESRLDESEE